ncbi:MAG: hypothetical protein H6695_18410 [Deferribacteres bacterium]|nr:hypothetical protein [candidate division KSB1 bacterium]MCB9512158.1 hypothetical protein [Deferribacteres bacterium]
MIRKMIALSLADLKNISRESTLLLVLFAPLALLLFLRFALPQLSGIVQAQFDIDLREYDLFIFAFMSLIPSLLFGMVSGFIMLDERDEDIIAFIAVTPLQKSGYFLYKLLSLTAVVFAFFFVLTGQAGLVQLPLLSSVVLASLIALEAPIGALFLAAFAENKVEGLALSKALGVMYVGPFVAFLVDSNWQFTAGLFPPFWIAKAFQHAVQLDLTFFLYAAIGLLVHLVAIGLLFRRFAQDQR